MSNTFDKKIVNGEVALKLLQGLKTKMDGEDVQATRVKGVLDISNIPPSALPTLVVVQDDNERFKLTTDRVKKGDTVKVIKTNKLYLVTDTSQLSRPEGYTEYAQTVDWSNIEGKPSSFPPSPHSQTSDTISHMKLYVKGQDTSEITTNDSLNTAIGKLEAKLDIKLNRTESGLKGENKDIVNSINKNIGQFIRGGVDNINQITEIGWYLCNSSCEGAPTSYEGIVVNYYTGDMANVKIWYSTTQESMYIKQEFQGVIKQEWTKIITQADINSVRGDIEQVINSKQNKTDQMLNTDSKEVVGAINELHSNKQSSEDGRLTTSDKSVVGSINELKNDKAEKIHNHDDIYTRTEQLTQQLAEKENVIVKKSAFNKDFGLTSGTVADGKVVADLKTEVANISEKVAPMLEDKLDKIGGKITGNLEIDGNLVTKNNVGVQCKDNKGTAKNIIYVDNSDVVKVGDGTLNIVLDSDNITLKGGKTLWNNQNFDPQTKQDVTNPSLQTGDKTVVGSINEVLTKVKKNSSDIANKAPLVHDHDDSYIPRQDLEEIINTLTVEIQSKEPTIVEKGTAFNKNFGTSVGTVLEGNNLATINSKIEEKQNKTDTSLQTYSKDIVGAINEIKTNTLGSNGGNINGAINSIEHNGAGNYNIVTSDERTVHGTLYGRVTSSDGVGEVGLYNKKSEVGIRLKDNGTVLIDSKTLTTTSKEMTGAINELVSNKFNKSGGDLIGSGEILRVKNNDSRGSAYIGFYNGGTKKGWIGRGSSGIDSIAMHNQYSGKGLTLKHDGGTHIDAMNLNTNSKEIVGAINELLVTKLNSNGAKMQGTLEFSPGSVSTPNIKFLSSDGSQHGSLNARSGDADEDIYLENSNGNTSLYLKDNGEVKLVGKKSMWISAPNLETKSKEVIGAINELNGKSSGVKTNFKINITQSPNQTITVKLIPPIDKKTVYSSTTLVECLYPSYEVSVIPDKGYVAGKPNLSVGLLNKDIDVSSTPAQELPITDWFDTTDPTGRDTEGQGKQGIRYIGTKPIKGYEGHDLIGFESTKCEAMHGTRGLNDCPNLKYVNLRNVKVIDATKALSSNPKLETFIAPELLQINYSFMEYAHALKNFEFPKLQEVSRNFLSNNSTMRERIDLPNLRKAEGGLLREFTVRKIFIPLIHQLNSSVTAQYIESYKTEDVFAPNLDCSQSSIEWYSSRDSLSFIVLYDCKYEWLVNTGRHIYIHPDRYNAYTGRDKDKIVKSWTEIPQEKIKEYGNPMDYYPAPPPLPIPPLAESSSLDEELDVVKTDLVKTQIDIDTCEKLGFPPSKEQLEKKEYLLQSHKNICEELAYGEKTF